MSSMNRTKTALAIAFALAFALAVVAGSGGCAHSADAGGHGHGRHATSAPQAGTPPPARQAMEDGRQLVTFPGPLRIHTLANMRDHLVVMGEIQAALAEQAFDRASELAEQRLGMSSLALHGAHDVARYMPEGMQQAGTAMHRAASRFAIVAKDASVSRDLKPALAALAKVNQTCVGCHAAYRLN